MNKKILAGALAGIGALSLMAGLGACADGETGHNFSDKWTTDEKFHWHICQDEDCDQKGSLEAHKWDGGTEREPATCDKAGLKTYECTVCHETKTEEITKLIHNWELQAEDSEASTCTTKGFETYKCSYCLEDDVRELQLKPHDTEDKHDTYYHWSECKDCDYTTPHTFHSYTLNASKAVCACGEEKDVTLAGTLEKPLALTANASHSLFLNKSADFDMVNGYYGAYFSFTPAKNTSLKISMPCYYYDSTDGKEYVSMTHAEYAEEAAKPDSKIKRGTIAGASCGYYEEQTVVGGPVNQFMSVDPKKAYDDEYYTETFELNGGIEYVISVKTEKEYGAYLSLSFDMHEHEYDLTRWVSDKENHWHASTCHTNAAPMDKAAHDFGTSGFCVCGKSAETETNGLTYSFNTTNKTATVSGWSGQASKRPASFTIPATKVNPADGEEYTVTSLLATVFQNDNMLAKLTLPSTITSIPSNAFSSAEKLKTLHITGASTDECLKALCNMTFGNNKATFFLASKGGDIYVNGELLENLDIEIDKNISDYAFYYCTSLKSVKINVANGVTEPVSIGNAFQNCTNLESIIVGDGVGTIGQIGTSCTKLTYVSLPSTLTSFNGCRTCSALKSVVINGKKTVEFGTMAFRLSSAITDIYFKGTEEEWNEVSSVWTAKITSATVHYYSETSLSGAWHLVDGKPEIWE